MGWVFWGCPGSWCRWLYPHDGRGLVLRLLLCVMCGRAMALVLLCCRSCEYRELEIVVLRSVKGQQESPLVAR